MRWAVGSLPSGCSACSRCTLVDVLGGPFARGLGAVGLAVNQLGTRVTRRARCTQRGAVNLRNLLRYYCSEAPGSHGGSTRTLISTPIPRVPRWASNSPSPPTNQRPLSITRQCGHGA
ncbi:hypothetical protein CKAH01_05974 [Colletotrichum kahawae]|uniref:Uncharacterized protein n=1 Tax=Colletotrichum kahawae TaxID=34407 RepID=A0AAE0D4X7_COLKA|nr:hypothetical protein CKAH01_05974 [Colletotrichum kahawae]